MLEALERVQQRNGVCLRGLYILIRIVDFSFRDTYYIEVNIYI